MRRLPFALLFLAAPLLAQEPTRLPLPEAGPPAAVAWWYGLYMQDTKVGWAKITIGRTADGTVVEESEVEAKFAAMGEAIDFRARERTEFDGKAPYALARSGAEMTMGPTTQKVALERAGEGYRCVVRGPGGEQSRDVAKLDYTFADPWTAMEWFRKGPKAGDALTVRTFDLEEARVDLDTYHVDDVRDMLVRGVKTRCYHGRSISSVEGETGTYTAVSSGDFVQLSFADMLEARLEDEETAKKIERGGDLFVMGTVPIDKKLGEPTGVTVLVVEVSGEAAARLPQGPRQSVEAKEDGTRVLRLGAAHGVAAPATAAEIEEALKGTTEFPAGDERIVALAAEAVGDAATPAEKVKRLVRFVSDYVEDVLSPAEAFNAIDVVTSRRGDCTEHAILFTALARAAGIPSRRVSGLMYMGDDTQAFGGHAWNEVVLDGNWVAVDPAWNQVEVDATHITIGHGEKGETAHVWVLGRLQFRLVSVERKP